MLYENVFTLMSLDCYESSVLLPSFLSGKHDDMWEKHQQEPDGAHDDATCELRVLVILG